MSNCDLRIFLHYFDIHFLESKGYLHSKLAPPILEEFDLATKIAIAFSKNIILPAASYFESSICHKIIMKYADLFKFGNIEIAGNATNIFHFKDKKLLEYPFGSEQAKIYSNIRQNIITPPYIRRTRSATSDIKTYWGEFISDNNNILNIEKKITIKLPLNFQNKLARIPDLIEDKAFILAHVQKFIGKESYDLVIQDYFHKIINQGYFSSYTQDFQSSIITDLVYLKTDYDIASFGINLPYRRILELLHKYGVFDVFINMNSMELLEVKSKPEWLKILNEALFFGENLSKKIVNNPLKTHKSGDINLQNIEISKENEIKALPSYFSWLHISDLHYDNTFERKYQIQQVFSALLNDLDTLSMKDPLLLPDVIFFTGDITQKSREDEYNNAWNFFFKPLLEKLSLSENQLFFIPGNHDVDRTKTTNLDSGIVQRITDSTDVYSLLNDSNKSGYLDQLIQRMTEYQKFQNKITKHKFHIEKLSWGNLFTTKDKVKIGIIGLNSSWTSASIKGYDGDVEEQGKLIVGKPLVEDAIEQVKKISSNYDLLITLIHHPIDWLMPWDQKDVRQIIRDNSTFLLHGHVHETNISFLGSPNPTTMVISAGTISKKLELQEINSCLHSYNIVRLDITNSEGKIYFRRFDPVSQRYGNDDTSFINAKDGIYSFNYKEDFNK